MDVELECDETDTNTSLVLASENTEMVNESVFAEDDDTVDFSEENRSYQELLSSISASSPSGNIPVTDAGLWNLESE